MTTIEQKAAAVIKSIRLSEKHLKLIVEECERRRLSFSDFARISLLGNLSRETKRRAMAQWGHTEHNTAQDSRLNRNFCNWQRRSQ
jgi:hypothetical protein